MTKRALITGAAGGLGQALACALDAEGYALVLTDLSTDPLSGLARSLTREPELIAANLRDQTDLARLCDRLEASDLPVDLLINNAGIGVPGAAVDQSSDLMQAHIDINLTAAMHLSAAAARAMSARKSGQIFSIVSLAGLFPLKDSSAYTASKFGLRGFMAALSLEMAPHNVAVGGLYPSAIDTPMLRAEMANPSGSPLNFAGSAQALTPEETANAVLTALRSGSLETWIPKGEGRMAGLVMTFPGLLTRVFNYLERQGNRKKQAYLRSLPE